MDPNNLGYQEIHLFDIFVGPKEEEQVDFGNWMFKTYDGQF